MVMHALAREDQGGVNDAVRDITKQHKNYNSIVIAHQLWSGGLLFLVM